MTPNSAPDDARKDSGAAHREDVRRAVLGRGLDRVGFARAGPAAGAERFRRWLEAGFAGGMGYLARDPERRIDPRRVLPGARTVIVAALHHPPPAPAPPRPAGEGRGVIAAYARGADYHRVLERRLRTACEDLRSRHPAAYRWYVDTGPVLERDWAQAAGVGWIGKNTCAIDPSLGSYFFLGTILTDLEIEPDPPALDRCGTCRQCLDACPTGALVEPRSLDARRCISYLTIEHRGEVPEELAAATGGLVFGCDICQEVCPFNRRAPAGDPKLAARAENLAPALEELSRLEEAAFRQRFRGSAVRRAKLSGLLRSVAIALGNAPSDEAAQAVRILEDLAGREEVRADPALRRTVERARKRAVRPFAADAT